MPPADQFSFEELRRLLDLRPDGATAAVVLQCLLHNPSMEPQRVDVREDEGIVVFDVLLLMDDDATSAPVTLTVALSPLTRKDLSYRMRIETQFGERMDLVPAENWRSEFYPIEEV